MISFNELRISPDSKHLIIEAEVDSDKYFDKVYINSIIIDTQDTYSPNGPSDKAIYHYTTEKQNDLIYSVPDDGCQPIQVEDDLSYCFVDSIESQRKVRLVLSVKDLGVDLNKNIFFVYAIANGVPDINTPCGWDKSTIMGTVVNLLPIYRMSMGYIKELNSSCSTPKGFIDSIFRLKAFELSIKTGNYLEAIKLWNKFFVNSINNPVSKCDCYGRTY